MAAINVTIADSIDDCQYENTVGTFNSTAQSVRVGRVSFMETRFDGGLRFRAVNVPQGTTVTTATITVEVTSFAGSPSFTIRANDVDDAALWADSAGDRPGDMGAETTASVSPTVSGTGNVSFDVSGICNEIFARGSWAALNDIRFTLENDLAAAASNDNFEIETQETAGPVFGPAQLDITFPGDFEMPQVDYRSAFPVTDDCFPMLFEGDAVSLGGGISSAHEEGLGIVASISADATWRLRFWIPETLPTGTAKLKVWGLADATSGTMQIRPWWASVAATEDPSSTTLNDETATTLTWAADEDDVYKEAKITLDADTIVAGEMVIMDLIFEAASTLAVPSMYHVAIIWE